MALFPTKFTMTGKNCSYCQDATWARNFTEQNNENQRYCCTRSQVRHFVSPSWRYTGPRGGWERGSAVDKGRARVDRILVLQGVNFSPSQRLHVFICKGGLQLNQMIYSICCFKKMCICLNKMFGKLYAIYVGSFILFLVVSFIKFQVKSHHTDHSTASPQGPRVLFYRTPERGKL